MAFIVAILIATYALFAVGVARLFLIPIEIPAAIFVVLAVVQWLSTGRLGTSQFLAQVIQPGEHPELEQCVDRVCMMASCPRPRLAVSDAYTPNAFVVGPTQRRSTLVVTEGLLIRLDPSELEAVVAHEVAHIQHHDCAVMSVASFYAFTVNWIRRSRRERRDAKRRAQTKRDGYVAIPDGNLAAESLGSDAGPSFSIGGVGLVVVVFGAVVYFASLMLTRGLSQYREFAADRGAVEVTKNPSALASALIKLSDANQYLPVRDLRSADMMNQFFIVPSEESLRDRSFATNWMEAHPPLEERLEALRVLERQLG